MPPEIIPSTFFQIHSLVDSSSALVLKTSRSIMPVAPKVKMQSKAVQAALSRPGHPHTPPDSPTAQLLNPLEFARQVIDTVKLIQTSDSKEASPVAIPQIDSIAKHPEPIIRASRLEVKEVHEV